MAKNKRCLRETYEGQNLTPCTVTCNKAYCQTSVEEAVEQEEREISQWRDGHEFKTTLDLNNIIPL